MTAPAVPDAIPPSRAAGPGAGTIAWDVLRFLTFRAMGPGVRERPGAYLATGLLFAWAAGVGRHWDNPRAEPWQVAGLGSVAYVFVLASILWAVVYPLRPARWTYRNVLLFVALTSPPAVLYAIPVERFMTPADARSANAWFLAVVAAWRVALFAVFLRREGRLDGLAVVVGALLPLCLIVIALAILNLEHVVFRLMGGIRPGEESPHDDAYGVVFALSWLAWMFGPIVFLFWAAMALTRQPPWKPPWREAEDRAESDRTLPPPARSTPRATSAEDGDAARDDPPGPPPIPPTPAS